MHSEILNDRQTELLPLLAQFRREYYLVGGTAIALYLGHRRSIDFDLFKPSAINHKRNLDKIAATAFAHTVTRRVTEQMNLIVNDVKVTFFQYPFPVEPTARFEQTFRLPKLLLAHNLQDKSAHDLVISPKSPKEALREPWLYFRSAIIHREQLHFQHLLASKHPLRQAAQAQSEDHNDCPLFEHLQAQDLQ